MLTVLLASALVGIVAPPVGAQDAPPNPRVLVETSEGDFEIELFKDRVPATVVNFLTYVQAGYYDGTIFHRVIRDVIVQGGGFVDDGDDAIVPKLEGLRGRILNEATNSLQNRRGTVAMARGAEPNTARQQFFINLDNNTSFNHKNATAQGFGYAVFGRVTDGMDVVRRIGRTRTTSKGNYRDVPREPIVIRSITQIEAN
ncbi:MAG: peptidylprolyl isomerase [Vicinamibacterales bacterium]